MFTPTEQNTYILESFQGPLDYLVYLIQKKEIDLHDVAIRKIIGQYLERVETLSKDAVDKGAEFIGTTASLLYLKSKLLLPPKDAEEDEIPEEPDPNFEVIHHLLEYVRVKEAARDLAAREDRGAVYYRGINEIPEPAKRLGVEHLDFPALEEAFQVALERAEARKGKIDEESWRVIDKVRWIKESLKESDRLPFPLLFSPDKGRYELIVTFLAVLELMKVGAIGVEANSDNTITLYKPSHHG